MRPSFSLRSFDTISMRGRSIRVLPCKMKIAFPGITGDVRRMKMPLPCCGHDNTVEGNWSLCLRSATPPPWFSTPLIRVLSAAKFHRDTNLALFLECRSVLVEIKKKREREIRVLLDCNYCHDFEYFEYRKGGMNEFGKCSSGTWSQNAQEVD